MNNLHSRSTPRRVAATMQWREGLAKLQNALDCSVITSVEEISTELFVAMQDAEAEVRRCLQELRKDRYDG